MALGRPERVMWLFVGEIFNCNATSWATICLIYCRLYVESASGQQVVSEFLIFTLYASIEGKKGQFKMKKIELAFGYKMRLDPYLNL